MVRWIPRNISDNDREDESVVDANAVQLRECTETGEQTDISASISTLSTTGIINQDLHSCLTNLQKQASNS